MSVSRLCVVNVVSEVDRVSRGRQRRHRTWCQKSRHSQSAPSIQGARGRFVSIYYDARPQTMRGVMSILRLDESVLRNTHLKVRNPLWDVNIQNEKKNPYIQRVMRQYQNEESRQQQQDKTKTI